MTATPSPAFGLELAIEIVRNPEGWDETTRRLAGQRVADELERLQKRIKQQERHEVSVQWGTPK